METMNEQQLYYDPFADLGQESFDPTEAFLKAKHNYVQGSVEHDYSADKFVADTEALMLEAQFIDRFDAVQAIAAQMHQMCGDDHGLRSSFERSSMGLTDGEHSENDGHNHGPEDSHSHEEDDDEDEYDMFGRKKKKRKK